MIAWLLVGLWAALYATISSVAVSRSRTAARALTPPDVPGPHPIRRVLVVRPCAGSEPFLEQTLSSFPSTDARFVLEPCFTVASADDPARPAIQRAVAALAHREIRARFAIIETAGPNFKTGQLAGAVARFASEADAIAIVDSDVDLSSVDFDPLLVPLEHSTVAATYFPPVEHGVVQTFADQTSQAVLGGSWHAFPILGALDPDGLVGKTFAIRADALRTIGGFDALVRHLGEDMELARRLRARGWTTRMVPRPVVSLASGRSLHGVVLRYARWLMVIRAQRPRLLASYPFLLAAAPPLLLGCLALGLIGRPSLALLVGAVVVAARLAVGWAAFQAAGRRAGPWSLLRDAVLADLLLWVAFVRALGPARVRWRDRTLRLGQRGLLEPIGAGPQSIGIQPNPPPREAIE